jgi:hypothetical protein
MADIPAIRAAIDKAMELYAIALGAEKDAEVASAVASDSVKKLEQAYVKARDVETAKAEAASNRAVEAKARLKAFQDETYSTVGVVVQLPAFAGGGRTNL